MNLSPLFFRIKKNIQKTNPSNNNYHDQITEGTTMQWTRIKTINVQHWSSFSTRFRKTRMPNIVQEASSPDTRLYLHNRSACYNGNWPVRCITPPHTWTLVCIHLELMVKEKGISLIRVLANN